MYKDEVASSKTGHRVPALLMSGALVASALVMPTVALADNAPSQVGSGSNGSGTTTLNVITADDGPEHDETDDNVAFTFPSAINYVIKADGSLIGPSGDVTYIGSSSVFPIHVSSVKTVESDGWSFVTDIADAGSTANCVELNLGPDAAGAQADSINAAEFKNKTAGADNMPAAKSSAWSMDVGGKVELSSQGSMANLSQDVSSPSRFGTMQWFVRAGSAA